MMNDKTNATSKTTDDRIKKTCNRRTAFKRSVKKNYRCVCVYMWGWGCCVELIGGGGRREGGG